MRNHPSWLVDSSPAQPQQIGMQREVFKVLWALEAETLRSISQVRRPDTNFHTICSSGEGEEI